MPRYTVTIDGREFDIALEYHADRLVATVDGQTRQVKVHKLGDTRSLLLVDNQSLEVDVRSNGRDGGKIVFMRGREIPVVVEDYSLAQMRKAAGLEAAAAPPSLLKAPMPGLIIDVKVEAGQKIVSGQPLVVIEAMKMENVLKSRTTGKVKAVCVSGGQSVEKGDTLVEFE
jgi:pyruvate carboxylase subunit B